MNRVEEGAKYWHNIDLFKGLLIICVFIGHIVPGSLEDNFIRYFIYAFHMPVFIGISGFLFKVESLEQDLFGLVKKYWHRVIKPWIVATFLFYVINIIRGGRPYH